MTSLEALEDLKSTINALSIFLQRSSKKEYQNLKIIEKDLECLKKMNEVWHKHEVMESVDINENHLEELYDYQKALFKENEKLEKENTKLKQALEILKDKIQFEDLGEMQSGNIYRGYFNDCFNEEEYELLKEVLGNE